VNRLPFLFAAGSALVLLGSPPPARATVKVVTIGSGSAYSPSTVTVAPGDTVRWTNTGLGIHTATSGTAEPGCASGEPDFLWDSGDLGPSDVFEREFAEAPGDYPYFCTYHACCCLMRGVVRVQAPVGIGDRGPEVSPARLFQNYPNPFNPETWIPFELSVETRVHLAVYDVEGRRVLDLVNGRLGKGSYAVPWRGVDREGREVPSGSYFARLRFGKTTDVRKMILSK
jgi:plastocyanin